MHDHNKKLYGTATVGTKGQVVIPVQAREELGIKEGDRLYVVGMSNSGVISMLPESMLERHIEKMNLHIEKFKSLKKSNTDQTS